MGDSDNGISANPYQPAGYRHYGSLRLFLRKNGMDQKGNGTTDAYAGEQAGFTDLHDLEFFGEFYEGRFFQPC